MFEVLPSLPQLQLLTERVLLSERLSGNRKLARIDVVACCTGSFPVCVGAPCEFGLCVDPPAACWESVLAAAPLLTLVWFLVVCTGGAAAATCAAIIAVSMAAILSMFSAILFMALCIVRGDGTGEPFWDVDTLAAKILSSTYCV